MNLSFSADELAFAEEVRAFVRANLDPVTRAKVLNGKLPSRAERLAWQSALVAKGLGGTGMAG